MPLSKARDRERKRLIRLESKKVQPKVVIEGLEIKGNRITAVQPITGTPWIEDIAEFVDSASEDIDADGSPIYRLDEGY